MPETAGSAGEDRVTDTAACAVVRVKAIREAAAAIAVWDQPQDHWPDENRCDRATVRRLVKQLHAMADAAERRTVDV